MNFLQFPASKSQIFCLNSKTASVKDKKKSVNLVDEEVGQYWTVSGTPSYMLVSNRKQPTGPNNSLTVRTDRRNEAGSVRVDAPEDGLHRRPNSWEVPPTVVWTTSTGQSLLCWFRLGDGHHHDDDDDDDDEKQQLQQRDVANQCSGGQVVF